MKATELERLAAAGWVAVAGYAGLRASVLPEPGFSICPFKLLTGLPCPGCGMGHALISAFQGHWQQSFSYHPLGLPLLALWTGWLLWGTINVARGRRFSFAMPRLGPRPAWATLVLVLAVYAGKLVK